MPEPETSERWPIARCRETLWEAACQILLVREELSSLRAALPLPDDLDDRLEHQKPYDIPTDMLAAVETVCRTLLAPAQAALERTAAATEEQLALEFEAEEQRWAR